MMLLSLVIEIEKKKTQNSIRGRRVVFESQRAREKMYLHTYIYTYTVCIARTQHTHYIQSIEEQNIIRNKSKNAHINI